MPGNQVKNWNWYESIKKKNQGKINPRTGKKYTKTDFARITNAQVKKKRKRKSSK